MSHPGDITTTSGKPFPHEDSAKMARMVFRRFGEDLEAATAAWNRMLGTALAPEGFKELMEYRAHEYAVSEYDNPTYRGLTSYRIWEDDRRLAENLGSSADAWRVVEALRG